MKVIWWFAVLVLSTVSLPSPSTFNIDCRGGNGGFNGGGGGGGCGNQTNAGGSCIARRADNGISSTAYCKFPFKSEFNYKTYTTCTRYVLTMLIVD